MSEPKGINPPAPQATPCFACSKLIRDTIQWRGRRWCSTCILYSLAEEAHSAADELPDPKKARAAHNRIDREVRNRIGAAPEVA